MPSARARLLIMCSQMTSMSRAAAATARNGSNTATSTQAVAVPGASNSKSFPPHTWAAHHHAPRAHADSRRSSHGSSSSVERARLLAKIQERLERRKDKSLESYIRAYERAHAKEMSVSELQELNVILSQTDESLASWLVRVGLMRQISPHQ